MKNNIGNCEAAVVYGFYPEIPGNSAKINIDSNWVMENVAEYKKLGHTVEKCEKELTSVVTTELFHWTSPEMEAKFHEDIRAFFAQ